MDFEFVRHEPLYDRILLVLTLDRQKMKERILIGEELRIRFRLQGYDDTDLLCDVTRLWELCFQPLSMIRTANGIALV